MALRFKTKKELIALRKNISWSNFNTECTSKAMVKYFFEEYRVAINCYSSNNTYDVIANMLGHKIPNDIQEIIEESPCIDDVIFNFADNDSEGKLLDYFKSFGYNMDELPYVPSCLFSNLKHLRVSRLVKRGDFVKIPGNDFLIECNKSYHDNETNHDLIESKSGILYSITQKTLIISKEMCNKNK